MAAITITADDKSKVYGAEDPELTVSYSGWKNGEQTQFLGSRAKQEWYAGIPPTQGLLSTNLGDDGYPTATESGQSMKTLYDPARIREVNHLFLSSTYDTSGYFVFDSTQNTATLANDDDNFTVYQMPEITHRY